jgi:hypothetical protein
MIGLLHERCGRTRVALHECNDPQLAVGAILPSRVAQLVSELQHFPPVAFCRQNVPFEIDVALDCQSAEPQPRIAFRALAVEIRGDLFGDVWKRKRLHLAAQTAELRVQTVSAIAGLSRGLLDFGVDREGVVPIREPSEAVGFRKLFQRVWSLREGGRGQENSDRNETDAADQSNTVACHDSLPRFAGAPEEVLQPQVLRIKPARRLSAAPGLPLGAETSGRTAAV